MPSQKPQPVPSPMTNDQRRQICAKIASSVNHEVALEAIKLDIELEKLDPKTRLPQAPG